VKTPNSYEDVMKEVQEINDLLENSLDTDDDSEYNADFKFEYAHESITERHTPYKRRYSHV
jgi:hypothetical protein